MRNFVEKHDKQILRLLEILPGFVSWNLILLPYWGIFVIPTFVAYFVLFFNIYWFYQSLQIAITSIISHTRIQASKIYDWMGDVKDFQDWKKIKHVVIIPTYKEPFHILDRTFTSLAAQTLPTEQIIPVLAMENNEPEKDREEKWKALKEKYGNTFKNMFMTVHTLVPGEVVGKASNEKHAATWVKENYIDKNKLDINYFVVSSCDADHKYHPQHFACLTYKFLDNPHRYKTFWQPAVMFYNNIWEVPAITRVPNTLTSIYNLSQLPRKDKLINTANYALSFTLLDKTGYWDADKIPEDWGLFFKSFYKNGGGIEVEPIYLPLMADAPESNSFWKTIKNQYQQQQRWAWGVSDDPWVIKSYFLTRNIPFWDKTTRLFQLIWSHFLWPVNWFIISIGLTVPTLLNPAFGRTALGYTVPKLSSFILTIALGFLVVMIVIDNIQKPKRPKEFSLFRLILTPFEFILMPIAGFLFNALPGIDAHTRLMLGKYIEYKVTEKV